MRGIDGRPFIALDRFLNLEPLLAMLPQIERGIARAGLQPAMLGPGILRPELDGSAWDLCREKAVEMQDLTHPERILYCKLRHGLQSALYTVYLRHLRPEQHYRAKAEADATEPTPNAKHFGKLLQFIASELPFTEIGRVLFFVQDHGMPLPIHRDSIEDTPHHNEFIWLDPKRCKPLFVYDEAGDIRHYVQSRAVFFNDRDYHGADSTPAMTYSLRIDGKFTPEFRQLIEIDHLEAF